MELKGYKLLKELCELVGPSGFEQDVQRYIKASIEEKVNKLEVDALGNVIATISATDASMPSILLAAHADEIGFIVKKIEANGTLRFEQLGGFDNRRPLCEMGRPKTHRLAPPAVYRYWCSFAGGSGTDGCQSRPADQLRQRFETDRGRQAEPRRRKRVRRPRGVRRAHRID